MRFLVTGAAGFIGYHTAKRLLDEGHSVIGIDNMSDYYDVTLKESRVNKLLPYSDFSFIRGSICDSCFLEGVFEKEKIDYVINLAAQAGVRYSLVNPMAYIETNVVGFMNILEACRNYKIQGLLYASSSSVYGGNDKLPFATSDKVDKPISIYAATKRSNELMAYSYSHLYRLPTIGLRFFTVYGPYGRPDMALFLFTKAILEGKPIQVFNHGHMVRDFTYVDDIVEGIYRLIPVLNKASEQYEEAVGEKKINKPPYRLFNIGSDNPIPLVRYIETLERELGKKAIRIDEPMQPGDVPGTHADVTDLIKEIDYKPLTTIEEGIASFVKWYRDYYKI